MAQDLVRRAHAQGHDRHLGREAAASEHVWRRWDAQRLGFLEVSSLGGQFWASFQVRAGRFEVTEATGVQSFHLMAPSDSAQLVGRALPGYSLGLTEEGEVLVAGAGLARGYLGLPEEPVRIRRPWFHRI